jgi:hypothetical protein
MLACVIEARLIVRLLQIGLRRTLSIPHLLFHLLLMIIWVGIMFWDFVALSWCLKALSGDPVPESAKADILRAGSFTAATLVAIPAALSLASVLREASKLAGALEERRLRTRPAGSLPGSNEPG